MMARWLLLGDSIQAAVYGPGPATALTASQLPGLVGVGLQNLSSPGMRLTQGGEPGTGAYANMNAVGLVSGAFGASGLIITIGTNDWTNPPTTGGEFSSNYQAVLQYAKSLGLQVVCVSPIFRSDEGAPVQHTDATYWLANFRTTIASAAASAGVHYINGGEFPGYAHPEWYSDGVHLSQAGHEAFAPWLVAKMRAIGFWL